MWSLFSPPKLYPFSFHWNFNAVEKYLECDQNGYQSFQFQGRIGYVLILGHSPTRVKGKTTSKGCPCCQFRPRPCPIHGTSEPFILDSLRLSSSWGPCYRTESKVISWLVFIHQGYLGLNLAHLPMFNPLVQSIMNIAVLSSHWFHFPFFSEVNVQLFGSIIKPFSFQQF